MNQMNSPSNNGFKKSVFISHASKNFKIADEIRSLLEARGVSCWIAPRDIPGGYQYGTAIVEAICDCTMTLLVLTDESNQSSAVRNEIERAFSYQKTIVPIRLREVAPSKELEFFVSNAQWVDAFASPLRARVEQVINIVHALELKQPVPQPQPEKPTLGGKLELFLERALRHKVLSAASAFALLSSLTASVLWMQIGSQEKLQTATTAIGTSASKIEVAASNIEQTSSTIKQVDSKLDQVKKETSADPRKELANRGVLWSGSNLNRALRDGDSSTVALFLEGGMRLTPSDVYVAYNSADSAMMNLAVTHQGLFVGKDCPGFLRLLGPDEVSNASQNQKRLVASLCTNQDARAYLKHAIEAELAANAGYQKSLTPAKSENECVTTELAQKNRLLDEALAMNMGRALKGSLSSRDAMLADIQIGLTTGQMSDAKLNVAVKKYCVEQMALKRESAAESPHVRKFRNILEWVS